MAASAEAILRILSAGPGATLQDAGRHGYLRFGVTAAGPMDRLAHATANLAVGNQAGATALEVSVGGIEVTAESAPLHVAVAGAEFALSLDGGPLPPAVVLTLGQGAVLKIRAGSKGSWCYLAIAGRLNVPKVLGYTPPTRAPDSAEWTAARSSPAIVWESNAPDRRRRRRAPSWRHGSTVRSTPFVWCLAPSMTISPTIRLRPFWPGPGSSPPRAIAWRVFSMVPG